jgi:hypothetical protein
LNEATSIESVLGVISYPAKGIKAARLRVRVSPPELFASFSLVRGLLSREKVYGQTGDGHSTGT